MRALGGHAEGDVAGAASHVEDALAGSWLHLGDEAVLPEPVHAARHEVVHQVIIARDRGEDPADAARLFLGADQLVTEIDLVHGAASSRVRTASPYMRDARTARSRNHRAWT